MGLCVYMQIYTPRQACVATILGQTLFVHGAVDAQTADAEHTIYIYIYIYGKEVIASALADLQPGGAMLENRIRVLY